jgi:hypothetical protein
VHVRAVLAGMKYAARVMAAQGTGSIINVASVNRKRAGLGGHYYASILPRVTTGNTMAPCVIIGECAAAALRNDHKLEEDWAATSTD